MAEASIQVYELAQLGIRAFYTPPAFQKPSDADAFSYYSHKHPYYELHLILQGTLALQAADALHTLQPGEFCLISPNVTHAPKSNVEQVQRYCIGLSLSAATEQADFLRRRTHNESVCIGDARQMLQTLAQLQQEADCGGPFSREMTGYLLSQLVLQMLRQMALSTPAPREKAEDLNDLRTIQIDHFLNNSFHLQGAQQHLAKELCISRRQLDRVFKALYGKGFQEKLLEVRAAAACDLLRGDLPIGEIALRVGYSTSANFTVFFKSIMGMTPTQYRKKYTKY